MPKVVSVPPPIPKELIPKEGKQIEITDARIATNVYTSLGSVKKALALTIKLGKEEHSHLFSLDREVITGSVGRLLSAVGATDTESPHFPEQVAALKGRKVTVANRGGKLYWYP